MGHRLSRITTRTGDKGTTGLGDGSRVSKANLRIHALGDVDELNSAIGVLLAEPLPDASRVILVRMQHDLFDLGGELSIPGHALMQADHVLGLEEALASMNGELQPLKEFILPGGTRAAALAHLARTIARRAERTVWALHEAEAVRAEVVQYLNRASDLLFVLGRWLNRTNDGDVLWERREKV